MAYHFRVLQAMGAMTFGALLLFSTAAYAESVYLKDGTILRGAIKSEDEKSVLIEMGDTWKKVDKSNIEFIDKAVVPVLAPPPEKQPEAKPEAKEQVPQAAEPAAQKDVDLRVRFGSAATADEFVLPGGGTVNLSGKDSSNVQLDVSIGIYRNSNVGFIVSGGLFSRTHSGNDGDPFFPTQVDYDAKGLTLGIGMGIKASEHLHFEGKFELGMGAGNGKLTTPGVVWNATESGGYASLSLILGAYYTISKPGLQLGFELGTQSFSGDFSIRNNFGGSDVLTVNGSSSTANMVVGIRF